MRKIALVVFFILLIFLAANLWAEEDSSGNMGNIFLALHLNFNWDESKSEGKVDQKLPIGGKSFHLLGGATASETGVSSYNSGVGYTNTVNKFRINVSTRNNWNTKGLGNDYIDNSAEITYPVFKRIFIGPFVKYNLWWGINRDWILAGPIAYYYINDNLSLDVCPSSDRDRMSGHVVKKDKIGMNLKYYF